jgi:probable phosphoglycerate mutase
MSRSRRVVCWRHGQTVWNVETRFQGQTDIPLNDEGRAQAVRAARMLAALDPAAIVSSDLQRAVETAQALGRLTGLPVTQDKALRERSGGEWEGLTGAEIRAGWPEEYSKWQPPGGDPVEEVADAVAGAIERAVADVAPGGLLVVVGHGASLRLGIARLLRLPDDCWDALGGLSNCSWSVVGEGRRGWRLLEHNAGSLPEPVMGDDQVDGADRP